MEQLLYGMLSARRKEHHRGHPAVEQGLESGRVQGGEGTGHGLRDPGTEFRYRMWVAWGDLISCFFFLSPAYLNDHPMNTV